MSSIPQKHSDERKRSFSCFSASLQTQQHFYREKYIYAATDWDQKFLTTRIYISKKDSECLL